MKENTTSSSSDCFRLLQVLIDNLRNTKPGDRSRRDRWFALTITYLEVAFALMATYIVNEEQS